MPTLGPLSLFHFSLLGCVDFGSEKRRSVLHAWDRLQGAGIEAMSGVGGASEHSMGESGGYVGVGEIRGGGGERIGSERSEKGELRGGRRWKWVENGVFVAD